MGKHFFPVFDRHNQLIILWQCATIEIKLQVLKRETTMKSLNLIHVNKEEFKSYAIIN